MVRALPSASLILIFAGRGPGRGPGSGGGGGSGAVFVERGYRQSLANRQFGVGGVIGAEVAGPRQGQNVVREPGCWTVLDGDRQQPQPLQERGLRCRVHSASPLGGAQDAGDLEWP